MNEESNSVNGAESLRARFLSAYILEHSYRLSGVLNMTGASRGHWLLPLTPTLLSWRRTRVLPLKTPAAINVDDQKSF